MISSKSLSLVALLAASPWQSSVLGAGAIIEPPPASEALPADNGIDAPPAETPLLDPTTTPKPTPSQNAMTNLINLLVMKGNLTKLEGAALIQQAEADAATAKAQAAEAAAEPGTDDQVRVTYIPETVRARMRDEIKDEVLAAARQEKWTAVGSQPEWVGRFKPLADIRLRYEYDRYPAGNENTGSFPNFNAINTGSPFDISGTNFSPQYNVDEDRERMRLRVRFGTDVDLGEGFTGGIRIATGENNAPVTTNQSLGLANQGQGGNFSKYAIWLDRAFLRWDLGANPDKSFTLLFGRYDNPFFSSDVLFDEDLGFDGLGLKTRYQLFNGVTAFAAADASPVFNTDLNFSSNQPSKFKSTDKWLVGAQFGLDLKPAKKIDARLAVGYYDFKGVEGELSDPYTPLAASDAGNTDNTRPSFAQKGNTYRPLRNIIPSALNNFGTTNQFQYFGLATPFRELALTGRIDFNHFEPFQISVTGEYIKNLAFNAEEINKIAVNNRGPLPEESTETNVADADGSTDTTNPSPIGKYEGGDTAWNVNLLFGKPSFEKRWDWNAKFGYRYVESDSVVDGFTDSEFAGGGTNVKGFTVGASVALSKRVKLGLQWMSAQQIAGPQLKSDIFQIDLSTKF